MYIQKLRELRKEARLTQDQLGEILKVPRNTIQSWEGRRAKPPIEQIRKAAEYFNVSFDYLFNDDYVEETAENKINQALNESGLSTPDENFTMEEIERSIDIIRTYREKEKELEEKIRKEIEEENNNERN